MNEETNKKVYSCVNNNVYVYLLAPQSFLLFFSFSIIILLMSLARSI